MKSGRYYPRRRYGRKAAPKRKYARRVYKKSSFAKRVKKVLHSQIENKIINSYGANQSIAWAGSVTNPTFIRLVPGPSQGVAQSQRIGNEIRVLKAEINGYVNLKPYSATTNPSNCPVYVKMWLCRRKSCNNVIAGDPSTTDFSYFFQTSSTSSAFQSNMLDMVLNVNNDYCTVFATKTIQLDSLTNPSASNSTLLTGKGNVSVPFRFNFGKHLGLCKFNDNVSNIPMNKELFLVWQQVLADGSTPSYQLDATEFHFQSQFEYEDA